MRSRSRRLAVVRAMVLAALVLCTVVVTLGAGHTAAQGVRVVDAVTVTADREEVSHALDGEEMTVGVTAERKWRSATGWFSYTLRIYEDTALTIACMFADADGDREAFDILVDDRKVATRVREPGAPINRELKIALPLSETAGKSEVTVTFRAHPGAHTGRLLEVRSVQEHLE